MAGRGDYQATHAGIVRATRSGKLLLDGISRAPRPVGSRAVGERAVTQSNIQMRQGREARRFFRLTPLVSGCELSAAVFLTNSVGCKPCFGGS